MSAGSESRTATAYARTREHLAYLPPGRRLSGRLRFAHYPLDRRLAQFEFGFQPSIDRVVIAELVATVRVGVGRIRGQVSYDDLPAGLADCPC